MNLKMAGIGLNLFIFCIFLLGCQSEQEKSWEKGIEPYYNSLPIDIEKQIIANDTIYNNDSTINGYFLIYNLSNNEPPLSKVGKTGRIGSFRFSLNAFWEVYYPYLKRYYNYDEIIGRYSKLKGLAYSEFDLITEPSHDTTNCTTIAFIKDCPCDTSYTTGTYQTYVIEPFNKRKVGEPFTKTDAYYHIGQQIWLYNIKNKDIYYHKTILPMANSPREEMADFLFNCCKVNQQMK